MKRQLFNNKYRIPSTRFVGWDYRTSAPYFITICTKGREHLFGEIENGVMQLNDLGVYATETIDNITIYSNCATIINQQVMPNHVHILLELKNDTTDYQPNKFGPLLEKSLSSVINHFKGRVTKCADLHQLSAGWQSLFHDHIVRDEKEYVRIFEYISNNPKNWKEDKFFG